MFNDDVSAERLPFFNSLRGIQVSMAGMQTMTKRYTGSLQLLILLAVRFLVQKADLILYFNVKWLNKNVRE